MKIMIIGNGFDLNLGLETSYQDFIKSSHFESLCDENNTLSLYLKNIDTLSNWVDIEKEITNYSNYIYEELSTAEIKTHFMSLKAALIEHLRESLKKDINQESKAFKMIREEIQNTDKIYNFNYTNSIFIIADLLNIPKEEIEEKHIYVHGSIDNEDIIFGVEDKAKISPKHIFFKKSYNKNFGISDIGQNLDYHNDAILFGHSLGITDSSYFDDYISRLGHSREEKVLKFYYYGEDGYDDLMRILDKYTNNGLTDFKHNNQFIPLDAS